MRTVVLLCVVLATAGLGVGAAYAAPPSTDDGHRVPPRPQSFKDGMWWYDAMRLRQAHREVTGKGVTVAVIDDAVDTSVPELRGQDVRPERTCRGGRIHSVDVRPRVSHGTEMVSLIVGSGHGDAPGGRGVTGVAPDARVLFYEGDNPLCDEGDIATVLDDAVDQGADIISMSMGLLFDSDLRRAVQRAMDAGVVVVAAAGNFETHIYPATFPGVVAVGAVDQFAQLWNGTPRDATAAVAAPGVWVAHGGVAPSGSWVSEYYGTGTSASTAITAGALALVKSKYPDATGNQLIQQLIHTPAGDDGYDWQAGYGFGIVNVTKMLATSPTQWPDDNPLLVSPQRTLKEYPMWASSRIADPPGHDESTAGKAPHEATPTPGEPAAAGAGPGDGMPGWLWAVVGAAVVAAAGSTAFAARRGRGRQSIDHTKRQGV